MNFIKVHFDLFSGLILSGTYLTIAVMATEWSTYHRQITGSFGQIPLLLALGEEIAAFRSRRRLRRSNRS